MRVFFDDHFIADTHLACLTDATDIVATQVYQHHMLCHFLGVLLQVQCQFRVFQCIVATFACARNRSHGHGFAFAAHQNLRR